MILGTAAICYGSFVPPLPYTHSWRWLTSTWTSGTSTSRGIAGDHPSSYNITERFSHGTDLPSRLQGSRREALTQIMQSTADYAVILRDSYDLSLGIHKIAAIAMFSFLALLDKHLDLGHVHFSRRRMPPLQRLHHTSSKSASAMAQTCHLGFQASRSTDTASHCHRALTPGHPRTAVLRSAYSTTQHNYPTGVVTWTLKHAVAIPDASRLHTHHTPNPPPLAHLAGHHSVAPAKSRP